MKNLRYAEYLKSDTFKAIREKAITSHGEKCQLCNSKDNIHVHHRCYPEVLGEEKLSDLTILCGDCHSVFHLNQWSGKIKTQNNRYAPKGEITIIDIENEKLREIRKLKKIAARHGMVVVDSNEFQRIYLKSESLVAEVIHIPFNTGY